MRPGVVRGAISHWHFRCPQGTGAASRERNTNTGSEREPSLLSSPPAQPWGGCTPGGLLLAPPAGREEGSREKNTGCQPGVWMGTPPAKPQGLLLRARDLLSPDLSGLSREPDKITDVTAGSEVQTRDCRCGHPLLTEF